MSIGIARWVLVVLVALVVGCSRQVPAENAMAGGAYDVAIVPGCPTEADGTVSRCQWRRVAWAAHLYHLGRVRNLITSGGAAHSPVIEADAMKAALVALGVPRAHVFTETQALHTDQNVGYGMAIARALGFESLAMASDATQSRGMCAMAAAWGWEAADLPIDEEVVAAILSDRPDVRVSPGDREAWVRNHPAPDMIEHPMRASFRHYIQLRKRRIGGENAAPLPPRPEPTLVR